MRLRIGITQEEFERKVLSGEMQVHKFPLGEIATEIREFPGERVLMVQLLAGERFDEWKEEAERRLIAFGKEKHCTSIEAMARLGLGKKLRELGWKKNAVLMRKDI